MFLMDVNILVYAHREDTPHHLQYRKWLEDVMNDHSAYGFSELVLSGFLRVVTHPKIFVEPSSLESALAFVHQLRNQSNAVCVNANSAHWRIFNKLIVETQACGNFIPIILPIVKTKISFFKI